MRNLAFWSLLLSFLAISCKSKQHLAKVEPQKEVISAESQIENDAQADSLIQPYKKVIDKEMNRIIGEVKEEMIKAQPESTLGNFCADAIYKMATDYYGEPIDFALQNYGGMRVPSIAAGPITRGKIYELMPFENRVAILTLDGKATLQLIEHMAMRGGWPISASLRYEIFNKKPIAIEINGEKFDPNRNYKIAMPDYIANGGDSCDFLKLVPRKMTDKLVRKAFFEYILEHTFAEKAIHSKIDGRIAIRNN